MCRSVETKSCEHQRCLDILRECKYFLLVWSKTIFFIAVWSINLLKTRLINTECGFMNIGLGIGKTSISVPKP